MTHMYNLVYPGDDSGNDDGILMSALLTDDEVRELNNDYRNAGREERWVRHIPPERPDHLYHSED